LISERASPELVAHVASCPSCAQSLAELAAELPPAELQGADEHTARELLPIVQRAIARERGVGARLRELPTPQRIATALLIAVLLVIAVATLAPRADLSAYPIGRIVLFAAIYALALAALVRRALAPMQQAGNPVVEHGLLALGLGLPFALGALPTAQLSHEVSTVGQGHDCLALGALLGFAFMVALRAFDRATRIGPGAGLPWLLWAAGSLIANMALLFHCPIARPLHMWIVHGTLVPIALLSWLWGWSAMRTRLARS
jgi:hypothetical protein